MSQQQHRVTLQPAFILHGRDFRNTSRLLDVFTQDYGRISLVAKGARSASSKSHGILQPFSPLIISWTGKGEVQTLTGVESVKSAISINGKHVMSAYYINELLQRLITQHDPHPELFVHYQQALEQLNNGNDELALRRFEKNLLAEIGYGINMEYDADNGLQINENTTYYYDVEKGPIKTNNTDDNDFFIFSGQTLIDMANEKFTSLKNQKEAKQLMRIILNYHLGGKPLKTRSLHWYIRI